MANGKAIAVTTETEAKTDTEWEAFKTKVRDTVTLFGSLIFFVPILCLGIAYGIRAGIVTTLRKTLELYQEWYR